MTHEVVHALLLKGCTDETCTHKLTRNTIK